MEASRFTPSNFRPLLANLAEEPQLDPRGFAAVLACRGNFAEQALVAGVRRLTAGQYLRAAIEADGGVREQVGRYADAAHVLSGTQHTGTEAGLGERFGELPAASFEREGLGGRVGLPVTAVLDSQALGVALLERADVARTAMTFGEPRSRDLRGGRSFAARYRIPHLAVTFGARGYDTDHELIVGLRGDESWLQTAHMLAGWDALAAAAPVAVTGYLLDTPTGTVASKFSLKGVYELVCRGCYDNVTCDLGAYDPEEMRELLDALRARYDALSDSTAPDAPSSSTASSDRPTTSAARSTSSAGGSR